MLGVLSYAASALIRHGNASTICIYETVEGHTERDPQLVWVGDRGTDLDLERLPVPGTVTQTLQLTTTASTPGIPHRLLSEYPYRSRHGSELWYLELSRAPDSGRPPGPPCPPIPGHRDPSQIVAVTTYRPIAGRSTLIVFLALRPGATPVTAGVVGCPGITCGTYARVTLRCHATRVFSRAALDDALPPWLEHPDERAVPFTFGGDTSWPS